VHFLKISGGVVLFNNSGKSSAIPLKKKIFWKALNFCKIMKNAGAGWQLFLKTLAGKELLFCLIH